MRRGAPRYASLMSTLPNACADADLGLACSNCKKKRHECIYKPVSSLLHQESMQIMPGIGYSGSPGTFAGEVKAAIDAKFGGVSSGPLIAMPMSDAPLFELQLSSRRLGDGHVDKVLPPRRQADQLLSTFWRCIHPVDYFLDEKRFCRSYELLFEGRDLEIEERVFIATLNIVFAFATQVQESIVAAERNEVANTYFQRAWNLLRPESILWEPPSLEVVECLLLMSRYLQCTNNSHQAWMAVGSAIRIAQSLGIHLPKTSEAGTTSDQAHWRHHLWNCCVFADTSVSWVQGRTAMTLFVSQYTASKSPPFRDGLIQTLELHEIVHHIIMAQTPVGGGLAERFGLHGPNQKKEPYCNSVLQHEACLNQWEKVSLKGIPSEECDDGETKIRRLSLQFQLLHARILLFRPMVARCCFMQNNAPVAADTHSDSTYKGHMIQYGAFQCIWSAQKMITLLDKNCNVNESAYILPWWYRTFYLHMAGTIILAAMQSTNLFTEAVSDSWQQTLSVFKRHENLSLYIPQCAALFQSLSRKASHIRRPPEHTDLMEELSDTQFHDTFLEFGFHNDGFLFDDLDETWLSSFPSC
ncbi:fungal-specific transcription factor domain-containing protein [Trichoderma velutinum]